MSSERHKAIVKFLKELDPQQYNGLEIQKKELFADDIEKGGHLLQSNVTLGAVALTDVLNIHSGSAGSHNLYRLLQVYLLDKNKRLEINKIIKD